MPKLCRHQKVRDDFKSDGVIEILPEIFHFYLKAILDQIDHLEEPERRDQSVQTENDPSETELSWTSPISSDHRNSKYLMELLKEIERLNIEKLKLLRNVFTSPCVMQALILQKHISLHVRSVKRPFRNNIEKQEKIQQLRQNQNHLEESLLNLRSKNRNSE